MSTYRLLRRPAALALGLGAAACGPVEYPQQERSAPPSSAFACLADADEVLNDPLHPVVPLCRIGELASVSIDGRPVPGVTVVERGPV